MSNFDKRKSYKQDLSDNVLANMSYGDLKRIARRMNILTTNKTRTDLISSIKSGGNAKATISLPDIQKVLTSQVHEYNQQFPPIQRQPQQNSFQVQQPQGQMGLLRPPVGYYPAPMNLPLLQTIPKMQCMPYNIPPAQCMVKTPMKPISFPEQPPLGAGQFTTRWPPVHYQQASPYSPPFQTSSNSLLGQYPNLPAPGYFHQTPVNGAWIMKNSSLSQQSPLTCGTNVTGLIFNCPIIDCDVALHLFELAGHIQRIHSDNIGLYFEWETRFTVGNFYEHNKMLHIQNIDNRIILTTMDFVNGFLHVAMRYLPNGRRDRTTAIVHFKKQNDVVCKWEGLVPSYEEFISKNYCMVLNLRYCGEREPLSIKSIIL